MLQIYIVNLEQSGNRTLDAWSIILSLSLVTGLYKSLQNNQMFDMFYILLVLFKHLRLFETTNKKGYSM